MSGVTDSRCSRAPEGDIVMAESLHDDDNDEDDMDYEPSEAHEEEEEQEEQEEQEEEEEEQEEQEEEDVANEDHDEEDPNNDDNEDLDEAGRSFLRAALARGFLRENIQINVPLPSYRVIWGTQNEGGNEGNEDGNQNDGGLLQTYMSMPNIHRRRDTTFGLKTGLEEVPSKVGQELMRSGEFGYDNLWANKSSQNRRRKSLTFRKLDKEAGIYTGECNRVATQLLSQPLIPTTKAESVIYYDKKCYSGQFSKDGNFFYSCSQDFRVRMYDTSNPYIWKHYKTAVYHGGGWTLTDASLSPDNRLLAYSSINTTVYVTNTTPGSDELFTLEFGNGRSLRHFGIWSIRFSGDGREVVAGGSENKLYVYDLESRRVVLRLSGHEDDVNAVCFAAEDSPHILFSGSDDTTIKVWDRRSMSTGREVGVFTGHLEGLTYVDSKGDGRYILSNSKDQTMKLWDIRKMMPPEKFDKLRVRSYASGFDYRNDSYNFHPHRHPQDCSLVTFRGHKVLKTLIRCHFSPPMSSGSRYVYTGSADGKAHIYNLDATVAGIIDVKQATDSLGDPDSLATAWDRMYSYRAVVRDASWHPNAPLIAASSWNTSAAGTISLHSPYTDKSSRTNYYSYTMRGRDHDFGDDVDIDDEVDEEDEIDYRDVDEDDDE